MCRLLTPPYKFLDTRVNDNGDIVGISMEDNRNRGMKENFMKTSIHYAWVRKMRVHAAFNKRTNVRVSFGTWHVDIFLSWAASALV
jgi:hypothetical protein